MLLYGEEIVEEDIKVCSMLQCRMSVWETTVIVSCSNRKGKSSLLEDIL